ncbi:MAG: ABC transporter ATP-binding protein [Gammaproteobacteria bacterium]|nr:ABC transporter ATP-binding protein [Gammaproteobacteria bacterium]
MSITLDQVTKQYQGNPVVNDVSLAVAEGEFFVLLGPSGSGKSTLLRAIAGLTAVDHGRITLFGRDVTQVSAREREVGFVFQNYALFRHMTVGENIEFALRVRREKASVRERRRKELLELIGLPGMDDRLTTQLSGGQQQRVAVARALAHKPKVLLLDEPFGALDAKIREDLRRTIRTVQRELGITTILVTHDQEEAFALGDRLGVMNLGRLLEAGSPAELYSRPASRFVATFLGAANLILRRESRRGMEAPAGRAETGFDRSLREQEVVAMLRPEEAELAPDRDALETSFLGYGHVEELQFTGALERLRIRMSTDSAARNTDAGASAIPPVWIDVTRTQPEQRAYPLVPGQLVAIGTRRIHVLPTPLSSFTVCAESREAAGRLTDNEWLRDLAARMQTRLSTQVEPQLASDQLLPGDAPAGVAVVAAGSDCPAKVRQLLARGVTPILCLPEDAEAPNRVIVHFAGHVARRTTLAVTASVLRQVPAEAVFLGILPSGSPERARTAGVRQLLDVRSEAHSSHGLDVRTELRLGDRIEELLRELDNQPGQMLVLGLPEPGALPQNFAVLLTRSPGWPVLLA